MACPLGTQGFSLTLAPQARHGSAMGNDDGDRPRRSWKELDRMRDQRGGGGRRRDSGAERAQERLSKTAAYGRYKSNLDQLFRSGGMDLPESLRSKLGPATEEDEARRRLLAALTKDPSPSTLAPVIAAGYPLPDDARLLMRLLDGPDEPAARVVLEALRELLDQGKKVSRALLIQRLQAVRNRAEEQETLDLLDEVQRLIP